MIRIPLADPKTAALLREAILWYPVHATWIDREDWELTQAGDFLVTDTAIDTRVLMTLVTVVDSHVEFLRFRKRDADADLLYPVRVDALNHAKQYRTWEELHEAAGNTPAARRQAEAAKNLMERLKANADKAGDAYWTRDDPAA